MAVPTQTHALPPGSIAIDAAPSDACPATDQRGEPRNVDGDGAPSDHECDIGAFEFHWWRQYLPLLGRSM